MREYCMFLTVRLCLISMLAECAVELCVVLVLVSCHFVYNTRTMGSVLLYCI